MIFEFLNLDRYQFKHRKTLEKVPSKVSYSSSRIPPIFDINHLCHSVRHPTKHLRIGLRSYCSKSIQLFT